MQITISIIKEYPLWLVLKHHHASNIRFPCKRSNLKHNTLIKYEIEDNGLIMTACTKNELINFVEIANFTLNWQKYKKHLFIYSYSYKY